MNGLSEARAFGGCFVLGFQNLEQIHHLYGNHVARTMSSLLGTKLVFRVDDPYSTEHLSKVFGMQEILVPTKSISFGAHQVRDGVSLHHRDKLRPVIKPSDIAQLPNLSAYLKFPTDLPPTKLQFKYVSRSQITEPCIAKVSIQDQASLAESSTEALEPVLSAAPALRDVDTSRLDVPQPSVESRDAPIKPEPRLAYANIEMFEFTGTRQAIDEDSVE
jgi:type IV secretory pathway TraG/TraD family ATPase VirD4